jgi:ubiquinol-cytochrome c reductase iron-sulfur subunit
MADMAEPVTEIAVKPKDVPGNDGVRRRDFLNVAAVSTAALADWRSVSADHANVAVGGRAGGKHHRTRCQLDQPGQAIKAVFRKQPLFVRRLTPAEIQQAQAVPLGELRDPMTLEEMTKEGHLDMLVTMGVCTHLGCVPLGAGEGENRGEFGGYFCPCHGSHYDTAARIRKGPAPTNLVVPDYEFTSDTTIVVG